MPLLRLEESRLVEIREIAVEPNGAGGVYRLHHCGKISFSKTLRLQACAASKSLLLRFVDYTVVKTLVLHVKL